jgi:hypothetical protein
MSKRQPKTRKVVPYNERERNSKILNLVLQINEMKMGHVLTNDIRKRMDEFVKNGTTYIDTIDLPSYGRELVINLVNDKHQATFINFKYVEEKCKEKCCHHDIDDVQDEC